jgi:hypothetical protein
MQYIILTNSELQTVVDDEDFIFLNQRRWRISNNGYATSGNGTKILMHRIIANTPLGLTTDHINGDKLDNRKENLRVCTNQQNNWNKDKPANNKSGHIGVYWSELKQRWLAKIKIDGKCKHLGSYRNILDAADAREMEAKRAFGEYYRKPKTF